MSFIKKFSKKKQLALLVAIFSLLSLSPNYSPAEISEKRDQQKNIWTIVGEKSQLEVDLANPRIREQIEFYAKRPHTLNTITGSFILFDGTHHGAFTRVIGSSS